MRNCGKGLHSMGRTANAPGALGLIRPDAVFWIGFFSFGRTEMKGDSGFAIAAAAASKALGSPTRG
jgi:hypothetical protein